MPSRGIHLNSRPRSSNFKVFFTLGRFLWPYRAKVAGFLAAMMLAAAANLILPQAIKGFVDHAFFSPQRLQRATILIVGIGIVMMFATAARYALISWTGERIVADIRNAVFQHVLALSPGFFETRRTGEIISRLTSDVATLESVVTSTVSIALRSGIILLGCIVMMYVTNPKLASISFVVVPLLILTAFGMGRLVRRLSRQVQDRVAEVGAQIEENINAIRTVQAYNHQDQACRHFLSAVNAGFGDAARRIRIRALTILIVGVLVFVAIGIVVWVGGRDVQHGTLSIGALAAFLMYAFFATISVASLGEVWGSLQQAAGATERLFELLETPSPVKDAPHGGALPPGKGRIDFNQVDFSYPTRSEQTALREFSLHVASGENIALVGPSGAGKSTVLQLLLRFYDPQSGTVMLEGVDIKGLRLAALRDAIGLVPQEPVIFAANAWDNIRLGKPGASDAEVKRAALLARAADFIETLPKGYHTHLGEKGITLSGGQKQRLAIARALLRNPRILLLDEATSALDAENERLIQEALRHLTQDRTTIIVAHRLATVQQADRIVVMEHGHVSATGTHASLMGQGGLYAHLASLQFLGG